MNDNKEFDAANVGIKFRKAAQAATEAFQHLLEAVEVMEFRQMFASLTEKEKADAIQEFEKILKDLEEDE